MFYFNSLFFFFQAEDGIRDAQESRGLGDVYKRQKFFCVPFLVRNINEGRNTIIGSWNEINMDDAGMDLSLIHI